MNQVENDLGSVLAIGRRAVPSCVGRQMVRCERALIDGGCLEKMVDQLCIRSKT